MNILVVLRLEMLIRVRDFGLAHADLFPPATYAGQLFATIAAAVTRLEGHAATQASKAGAAREGTSSKAVARANLLKALEVINATARAIALKIPGLENKFRFPHSESDQALLAAARAFAEDAVPLKAEFVKRNLPETFIEDLQADIEAFAEAISARNVSAGSRVKATAAIDATLDEAMLAARELDPIVKNTIGDDKALLAEWRSARHVEKTPKGGKSPKAGTPPAAPTTPAA